MALEKCPECEQSMSDAARQCPHCGWRDISTFWEVVGTLVMSLLMLFSIGLVVAGIDSLTQATQGVGLIALGIWLVICFRLVQASLNKR